MFPLHPHEDLLNSPHPLPELTEEKVNLFKISSLLQTAGKVELDLDVYLYGIFSHTQNNNPAVWA